MHILNHFFKKHLANAFLSLKTFFYYMEYFVQWNGSINAKGSSWNHRYQ